MKAHIRVVQPWNYALMVKTKGGIQRVSTPKGVELMELGSTWGLLHIPATLAGSLTAGGEFTLPVGVTLPAAVAAAPVLT